MDLLDKARAFTKMKLNHMSTSDRVSASRTAKELVLQINEIYKVNQDPELMLLMKEITVIKQKIEKRLN